MSKQYELTILMSAETPAKDVKATLEDLVAKSGASVIVTDDWGKKDLAFEIKHQRSGVYLHSVIEAEPEQAIDLDRRLRLNEELLRYLLVTKMGKEAKAEVVAKSKSKKAAK